MPGSSVLYPLLAALRSKSSRSSKSGSGLQENGGKKSRTYHQRGARQRLDSSEHRQIKNSFSFVIRVFLFFIGEYSDVPLLVVTNPAFSHCCMFLLILRLFPYKMCTRHSLHVSNNLVAPRQPSLFPAGMLESYTGHPAFSSSYSFSTTPNNFILTHPSSPWTKVAVLGAR